MSALYYESDPCTDTILDFIAQYESHGDYNIVIGEQIGTRDLSKYTLSQIYQLQAQLARTRPSSAVGRYQIIHPTLTTLAAQARAPLSSHFTPAFQDNLGWLLLCQYDYRRWYKKEVDDERFAHNLSLEWASLPDPFLGGKSHYDGVGPNHAGTSLKVVYSMLEKARSLIA